MAKRKTKDEKPAPETGKQKLLKRIRERHAIMTEADRDNRQKALLDLEFLHIPGKQWDQATKKQRGDRPCYEYNKLRPASKRIVNDMRANRPQGKVRGVEDSDKDTAEVMEGLIRNIWNISDGDTVIDYAAEFQVGGGMGAWRINTEYADDSFTQDIKVEAIKNPFCLYADPACSDPLKRDADDWVLTEKISKASYEKRWPDAEVVKFEDTEFDDDEEWQDDETVRICEYWWKEPYDKEIWQLADGTVIDASTEDAKLVDPAQVVKKRAVKCDQIMMCIASGNAILTGPERWAGKEFPFVIVYGEWIVIDGKIHWFGITRFGKDAQRSYNVARTSISETIAMAPQSKYWATPAQALGHTEQWASAHFKGFPFQLANADPKMPGFPQRMPGPEIPVALIQETQISSEEIKSVTGIWDARETRSSEQSGKAILARQQQGEIATFNYSDNMGKAIRRTWEILLDIVPKVYDTARTIRTLGVDGAEKYAKINTIEVDPATHEPRTLNDLQKGKFDVTVTVGPSYATQRQESAETFIQLVQASPELMPLVGDLVFKSMDVPLSEQFAERLKIMLPPQIQQMLADGKPVPPEAQAAMQQANMAMQQVQEQTQLVQQAAQEVEDSKAESEKAKAEVQQLVNDLEVKKAQFEAEVAKALAQIQVAQANMATKEAQSPINDEKARVDGERESLTQAAGEAVQIIQQLAAQFMQSAEGVLAQLHANSGPKRKSFKASRDKGGGMRVDILEDGVPVKTAVSRRENGAIVGEVNPVEQAAPPESVQ